MLWASAWKRRMKIDMTFLTKIEEKQFLNYFLSISKHPLLTLFASIKTRIF